ncbi:hypothetical protein F5Y00DRAFT_11301 [Daldinia vernicosa]|uniref:uncharacterized protein n=1 Tax=Daldinia vernicosa TaxID=114800 RepID=UPI002007BEDF|nr:uncharacterized protein F5Y00DRAFT_11301 [Daldinia vernicosa]KAI0851511.1 hypothetical protein F5Y00DRAFT_11301 [Daldinia vernicosa]
MADEIRQTPIPVPHVYGQPAPATDTATPPPPPTTTTTTSLAGDTAAMTIEQPPLAPSTEQAASPAPTTTTTTTTNAAPAPLPTTAPATTPSNAPSPSPAAAATTTAAPPARTGTPLRATNGQQEAANSSSSRAASQHPDPGFTMPAEAPPHGAPVRQYLNSKVTGPLLDGMKMIAKEQPKDPLRALGEYLLQRSKELESTT